MKHFHKCCLLLGIILFTLIVKSYGRSEGFKGENPDRLLQRGPHLRRGPHLQRGPPLQRVPPGTKGGGQESNNDQRKKLNDTIRTLNSLPAQVMGASLEAAKEIHNKWHAENPNL